MDHDLEIELRLAAGEIEFILSAMKAGDYRVVQVLEQSLRAMKRALGLPPDEPILDPERAKQRRPTAALAPLPCSWYEALP